MRFGTTFESVAIPPPDARRTAAAADALRRELGLGDELRVYRDFGVRNGPQGTLGYLELGFGWPRRSTN